MVLSHRGGGQSLLLEGRNVHFGTGSDCPYIRDARTGERRAFLKQDVAEGIRLCDALPNIDFVLSIGLISDVPSAVSDIHQFEAMLLNTMKPIVFTAHGLANCHLIVEMAELAAGGVEELRLNCNIAIFVEANPPLVFTRETLQKTMFMAAKGLPVVFSSGPMMGVSGPQTHAGIIALSNAENLAGNTIVQLTRAGAPFVYAHGIHPLDMQTMVLAYGAPELSFNTAVAADLAHFYGLPVWGYAGCSDAKILDEQAAIEATGSIIMSLLSGNNLVHDVGYLESGLTSSFEMILLSDVVIGMARSMLKPLDVSPETLALDLIDRVGPGGSFIQEEHTLRHFREVWYSTLIDRRNYQSWTARGSLPMGARLNQRVLQLLRDHTPEPLPEPIRGALRAVVERAARVGGRAKHKLLRKVASDLWTQ